VHDTDIESEDWHITLEALCEVSCWTMLIECKLYYLVISYMCICYIALIMQSIALSVWFFIAFLFPPPFSSLFCLCFSAPMGFISNLPQLAWD
jgi:hypothetical protein